MKKIIQSLFAILAFCIFTATANAQLLFEVRPTAFSGSGETRQTNRVSSGSDLQLNAAPVGGTSPAEPTFIWSQSPAFPVVITNANRNMQEFSAPVTAENNATITFSVSARKGSATADGRVIVTIVGDGLTGSTVISLTDNHPATEEVATTIPATATNNNPSHLTYRWTQINTQPEQSVTFASTNQAAVTFTPANFIIPYNITLQLTVSDRGTSVTDTVTVMVAADDDPPTATITNPTSDNITLDSGATITLTGTAMDPELSSPTYVWSRFPPSGVFSRVQGSDTNVTRYTAHTLHHSDPPRIVTLTLTATVQPHIATDSITVTVSPPAAPPPPPPPPPASPPSITLAMTHAAFAGVETTISPTVTDSDTPSGDLEYSWVQVNDVPDLDLGEVDTGDITFTPPLGMTPYTVTLAFTVQDGEHEEGQEVTVTVTERVETPVITFPDNITAPEVHRFTFSDYTVDDPDGDNSELTYRWQQLAPEDGDLQPVDTTRFRAQTQRAMERGEIPRLIGILPDLVPSFEFDPKDPALTFYPYQLVEDATLRFQLTVTDENEQTATAVAVIHIDADNDRPLVNLGDQSYPPGAIVTLVTNSVEDFEDLPLMYHWELHDIVRIGDVTLYMDEDLTMVSTSRDGMSGRDGMPTTYTIQQERYFQIPEDAPHGRGYIFIFLAADRFGEDYRDEGTFETYIEVVAPEVVHEAIAPAVTSVSFETAFDAVSTRVRAAPSLPGREPELPSREPVGNFNFGNHRLGDPNTAAQMLTTYQDAFNDGDFKKLLDDMSFNYSPFGNASTSNFSFWGSGDFNSISGEADGVPDEWEGDITGIHLGFDFKIRRPQSDDLTAGLLVSSIDGDFTYSGNQSYQMALTGFTPYFSGRRGERDWWGSVGIASGDVTHTQAGSNQAPVTSDLSVTAANFGMGGWEYKDATLQGEISHNITGITPAATPTSGGKVNTSSTKLRASAGFDREHTSDSGMEINSNTSVAVRADIGDGTSGGGIEVGAGADIKTSDNLTVDVRARLLLVHSAAEQEWGIRAGARYAAAPDGQGLSFHLTPTYGIETELALTDLEANLTGSSTSALDPRAKINAALAYGIQTERGLVTPYTEMTTDNVAEFGLNWKLNRRMAFGVMGEKTSGERKGVVWGEVGF